MSKNTLDDENMNDRAIVQSIRSSSDEGVPAQCDRDRDVKHSGVRFDIDFATWDSLKQAIRQLKSLNSVNSTDSIANNRYD